ncbi:R3H domain-containing protein 2-like isoform X2 [Nymphalis io]|uniref:R3H domain-containing protein 2-like isoform X2 n=1 Tax=Inachis io TaxID=171585 RepID=UPI002169CD46|nr:R3H domain-containing protein 2-like isoform X2 [Nymphalis io]
MEQAEVDKGCHGSEDGSQLGRNRSFKTKQLVRSQAIRESTSPPRTVSPYMNDKERNNDIADNVTYASERDSDGSSHSDMCSVIDSDRICDGKQQPVEIQITSGAWEADGESEQRLRTRRWLGHRHHSDSSRDLLSYNPRVACVCGTCACPHCRGRRQKHACPTKQDSGIVCSDECPDCLDTEHAGPNGDGARKSSSFDGDDQAFYCRCPERKEPPISIPYCGNEYDDKAEPTGPELVSFIKETLNKNPRDRMTLLKIEKELHALVNDNGRCIVRFPVMTSYGRMLVHRCAALFQLAHHLDQANKNSVLVSKSGTSGGRIPCTSFSEWCCATFSSSPPGPDTLAKSILKRAGGAGAAPAAAAGRSKSLEQRERDYERVRRRIFSSDNCSRDESQWAWLAGAPVKLLAPEPPRSRLLKVQSLEGRGAQARGPVSKSHSFGGYAAEQPRLLSRQGDLASSSWRLSPSSSGYKTLSLRSSDSVTPSPTGGASPEPNVEGATLVWAVTDMSAVPPGALVIHPQTGRPLTNPDGSLYHFDPQNPPAIQGEFQIDVNNEKRRGKLEKQHSFVDGDCDCQATDDCRTKCYCDRRQTEQPQISPSEKGSPQKPKAASNPTSPLKTRYENRTKPVTPTPKPEPEKAYEESPKHEKYETTNQRPFEQTKQKYEPQVPKEPQKILETPKYETTNPTPPNARFESPANHRPAAFDQHQRAFDQANQRAFELANQRQALEHQRNYERQFDIQNQRLMKMTQDEIYQQHNYIQGFRNEEIISPQTMVNYHQQEVADMQNMMQAKVTSIPMPDPNMRPMSLTNMVYPGVQHNAYPFINACRIDQTLQPAQMYQPLVQQPEEQKQLTSSPHNDNTFRIDPSYPFAADVGAACGACEPAPPSGYNVSYGQVDVQPGMVPQYSIPNVLIQQPMQPYPYQEQMPLQWQSIQPTVPMNAPAAPKVMLHDLYPLVYPNVYQPYNIVYPQVLPQQYPFVQPVYPIVDKQSEIRRNSFPRPKRNPSRPQILFGEEKRYEDMKNEERPSDITLKIQQIKEQMAQVNTGNRGRNDWRRRNSGSGILGSYPVHYNGRVMGPNEDSRLTAAQAIVNSLRNMQIKNNYEPRRFEPRAERPDARPRRHERDVRDAPRACLVRQMSPGTWCRRSPAPFPPAFNQPRRPHPDARNGRR